MSAPPEVGGCVSSCGARLFVVADFVSLAAAFKKATGSLTPSPALLRYCRASRCRVESLCIAAPTPAPSIRHRRRSQALPFPRHRRRSKMLPSGTPLGLSAIAARLAFIPAPQQAAGEAAGGYFHHHTRLFRRAALPLARRWQAGIALTTHKNPTTGCDKCRKDSKGALPLWSVRRGFQRGTHRKGSPWRSFVPFWRQKGTARAA